jgi:hypothetical protein
MKTPFVIKEPPRRQEKAKAFLPRMEQGLKQDDAELVL